MVQKSCRSTIALLVILLLAGSVSAQDGRRIHRHKHYDTTKIEDHQRIKRRRLTTDVDSTGFNLFGWGGECFIKVKARDAGDAVTRYQTGMRNGSPYLLIGNNDYKVRFYVPVGGGFEYDAIVRNMVGGQYKVTVPFESQGVTFWYQDTLSDIDKLDSFRPDSVIGSYAVYHSIRSGNVYHGDGRVEEYKTGKLTHIFRPKVWDSNGDTTWGTIVIDTLTDSITIAAPKEWSATAVGPVTIDPTFGYATKGETGSGNATDQLWGIGEFTGAVGYATSMSIYTDNGSGEDFVMGIYDDNSAYPGNRLRATSYGAAGSDGWQTQDLRSYLPVSAVSYWLVGWWEAASDHWYDTQLGIDRKWGTETYLNGPPPDPFPSSYSTSSSRKYSFYVTYETNDFWMSQNTTTNTDTWIYENTSTTNYGSATTMTVSDAGVGFLGRIVINVTGLQDSIGTDKTIIEAVAFLHFETPTQIDTAHLHQGRRSEMSEDTATWIKVNTANNWTTAGAGSTTEDYYSDVMSSQYIPFSGGYRFDIDTSVANAALQDTDTLVLMLRCTENEDGGLMDVVTSEGSADQPIIWFTYIDTPVGSKDYRHSTTDIGERHNPTEAPKTARHRP